MNKRIGLVVVVGALMIGTSASCWHVTVYNDTDYVIEAKCKKVGAVGTHSEIIQPKKSAECGCGAADCSIGVSLTVYELYTGKDGLVYANDIRLSESWALKCSNKTVHVGPDSKGSYKIK
jgi:hypothetical protein